jgi:spore maturation protein CgeB
MPIVGRLPAPIRAVARSAWRLGQIRWQRFPPYRPLKSFRPERTTVAVILDEFSQHCFAPEWNLILLDRHKWREQIERGKPAFVFVESAWRGNGRQWSYTLTRFSATPGQPLYDLVLYCRQIGMPTVYWGKEDPAGFDAFGAVAKEFDYIFTTDADCIDRYKALCSHDRVYALPFAAQPVLHNPSGREDAGERQVAFAGGWHSHKHPQRAEHLIGLFDAVLGLGLDLVIFDRFAGTTEQRAGKHSFPVAYQQYVQPGLSYARILSAYRRYPIFLNVNSVEDSPTMFSRRVFELLACGTNVVSSPSKGMEQMLPGVVAVARDHDEARRGLSALVADSAAARRRAHLGYRLVMREHTYARRAYDVVRRVAPDHARAVAEPSVSVILATNRPDRLGHALDSYRRQSYGNRELVLVLNSPAFSRPAVEDAVRGLGDVKILQRPETDSLAVCLNVAIAAADGDYWAKFDDDDEYGTEYLADALLPFSFTDASIVGKNTYFARIAGEPGVYLRRPGQQHRYVNLVCGGTFVADRRATSDLRFDESLVRGADTAFLRQAIAAGHHIYSADPYNFIQVREADAHGHTWTIDRDEYLSAAIKVSEDEMAKCVFL